MGMVSTAIKSKAAQADQPKLCKFGLIMSSMDVEDREAVEFVIPRIRDDKDTDFTIVWLVSLLKDNGITVGKTVVSDHIGRRCCCDHH